MRRPLSQQGTLSQPPYRAVGSAQLAPTKALLTAPQHMRRAQARLSEAQNRLCNIVVCGDSVSVGAYANDSGTLSDDLVFRRRGWIGTLRNLLGRRYGYAGEGILFPSGIGTTVPYTYQVSGGGAYAGVPGAGATNQSIGLYGRNFAISTTGWTVTATVKADPDAPAGSKMAIRLGLWTGGGSVMPTISVDGGAATAVTGVPTAVADAYVETTLAVGLDPTVDHTLSLVGPSSFRPMWFSSYINAQGASAIPAQGIAVHRMAESGTVLADAFAHGAAPGAWSAASYDRQVSTALAPVAPDLVILAYNVNNLTAGWTRWAYTPAQVQTYTQTVVSKIQALVGADVLLMNPVIRDPSTNTAPYTQADYSAALAAVATATDYCSFLDIGAMFDTYTDASALGLYAPNPNGGGVHPGSRGHAYIARGVMSALGL